MKMLYRLLVTFLIIGCKANHLVQMQSPCNFLDTINITSENIDQNGNYHLKGVVLKKEMFASYNYIVKNLTQIVQVEPHIRGCICDLKPCIRLCCTRDESNSSDCIQSNKLIVPTHDEDEEIDLTSDHYGVLVGRPCAKMYKLEPQDYPDDRWYFMNGSIQLEDGKIADHQDYCFGQMINDSNDVNTEVLFCYYSESDVRLTLYPIGMIFSLPFLVITFCVYGFIPEMRNLHGKSLMCYVFGLTVLYVSLSVVQLEATGMIESLSCILSGYMIYVSVLLCFFWLNVMCIDIWSTFRSGIRGRGGDRKRFLLYCLYAFGVPFFLTGVLFIIDISSFISVAYRPLMGIRRCWMQDNRLVEAIYTYTPISIILIINIALYSITAYRIYQVQRETSVIRNVESRKHSKIDADKERFFLYLRLFIVMGVTWSMESISWIFENRYFFYVSDLLNCLQGFIIFILFVWKPKVKKLIIRRYRSIRRLPPTTSQMHSVGSMRTETSRISTGTHPGVKVKSDKPMLYDS